MVISQTLMARLAKACLSVSHWQQHCWRKTSTTCKPSYSKTCQILFNIRLLKELLFVFLVSSSQRCCRECGAVGARLLLNNRREAIKSGKEKKVRNKSPTFEILFMLVPGVGAILCGAYFQAWLGQDHEGRGPGALNRFQRPRR